MGDDPGGVPRGVGAGVDGPAAHRRIPGRPAGLRVSAAAPQQLSAVGSARSRLSGAEDYAAMPYHPDDVRIVVPPAPPCTTPTCTVSVTLTNGSNLEARGVVTITVTAGSPNAGVAAGRDVTVRYQAVITAS